MTLRPILPRAEGLHLGGGPVSLLSSTWESKAWSQAGNPKRACPPEYGCSLDGIIPQEILLSDLPQFTLWWRWEMERAESVIAS